MKIQPICRTGLILHILALFFLNKQAFGNLDDSRDSILTAPQKEALQKFKELMAPQLEQDRMKKDVFLLRWLRARNFNVDKASEMLKKHLEWRQRHNFDKIHEQDWSYFEKDYPIYFNVSDTDGRPTMLANHGDWDIQKASTSGQTEKLALWVAKAWDKLERQVDDLQKQGSGVTRWNMLFDNDHFPEESVCKQCLPFYSEVVRILEQEFPHGSSKIWFLNSRKVFHVVVQIHLPIITLETKQSMKLYDRRSDWEPIVLKSFSKDQLPVRYGGTIANHPLN